MSVNITLANGQLGQTIQTEDGICGIVMTGAIDGTGDYELGVPILITSNEGLTAAGITTDGNAFAVRQVSEFYQEAGAGAQLYLMLVPNTLTVADMADAEDANGAKKLLDYAKGRIKVLGIMSDDTAVGPVATAGGLNDDVFTAITNMEVLAAAFFAQQKPFRAIIGGTSYAGVPGDLTNLKERSDNRCAVLVGGTTSSDEGMGVALGLLLGKVASIPVEQKVSRVADGALPIDEAWLGDTEMGDVPYDAAIIEGLGYITFKAFPHLAGYFWSGDRMATGDTDDYKLLARGRIIDKAHVLAYKTYILNVDDKVPVDADSGKLEAGFCAWLEQQIVNQLNNAMVGRGEIVSATAFVNPDQNVLSTEEISVSIGVVPYGYAGVINVTLGFVNPAA